MPNDGIGVQKGAYLTFLEKTVPRRALWASGPSFSDSSQKAVPNDGIGVQKGATSVLFALLKMRIYFRRAFFSAKKSPLGDFKRFAEIKFSF